jgi:hypothetical protein
VFFKSLQQLQLARINEEAWKDDEGDGNALF